MKTNASDWLGIDKVTGILSGTPEFEDIGSYWVEVTVFDGEDGWDYANFTLWVTTEEITEFPPELTNPKVTPSMGDTSTDFTFSVDYSHPDDEPPDVIKVVIDSTMHEMSLVGDHYEFTTKLTEGNHSFYFTTTQGEFTVNTGTFNVGPITKLAEEPDDKDEDDVEDNTWLFALLGIIIIIVVLVLLFEFFKKKKGEEEPAVGEPAPPPPAEVPPEQTPVQEPPVGEQPPTEEAPLEQPPAPETPPEQVPRPETPPTEQPPPPEVTPQVPQPSKSPRIFEGEGNMRSLLPKPQVEQAPEPEPMPQVEEQPALQPQGEPQPEGQAPVPKVKTQPIIKEKNG
jgi:hypothetical protein